MAKDSASFHITWQDFARFVQRMRRRRGISQERLAQLMGCHRTHIWRLEHGRSRPSGVFLHSLKVTCALEEQEADTLAAFIQLHESHCDTLSPTARA